MWRIRPISDFLNNCIDYTVKVNPILTRGISGCRPWYLRTDIYSDSSIEWVASLPRTNNTFIIAKSLSYPPMYRLENEFVSKGLSCRTANYNGDPVLSSMDKIIFTPLEFLTTDYTRHTVIVMSSGMDSQELFKSTSRATDKLYIIDDARDIDKETDKTNVPIILNQYVHNVNIRANGAFKRKGPTMRTTPTVDVDTSTTNYCILQPAKVPMLLPKILNSSHKSIEDSLFIADINGLAIPMIYEFRTTGKITLITEILKSKRIIRSYKIFAETADYSKTQNVLKLANIYLSHYSGYRSRAYELDAIGFDWLSEGMVQTLMERMSKHISPNAYYEVSVGKYKVDIVDEDTIWEIKCKRKITQKDISQILNYALADNCMDDWYSKYNKRKKYKLFNILTDEIIELI